MEHKVLRKEILQLVLERVKEALMDAEDLEPYIEKLKSFEPSSHLPDRVSMLGNSDYETEYRNTKEYLSKQPNFAPLREAKEKYSWGVGEIDIRDSDGVIFTLVNNYTGAHIRVILLREPLKLPMLIHELLHIFEEYLNLSFGELARFSQSIADRTNIKIE